jgi:hypothetical protein
MRIHAEGGEARTLAWSQADGTLVSQRQRVAAVAEEPLKSYQRFRLPTLPNAPSHSIREGFAGDPVRRLGPISDEATGVLLPYRLQPLPHQHEPVAAAPTIEEWLRVAPEIDLKAKEVLGKEVVDDLTIEAQTLAREGYQQIVQLFQNKDGEWMGRLKTLFRKELTQALARALSSVEVGKTPLKIKEFLANTRLLLKATQDLLVAEWKMAYGRQGLDRLRRKEMLERQAQTQISRRVGTALRIGIGIAGAAMLLIAPQIGVECLVMGETLSSGSEPDLSEFLGMAADAGELLDAVGSAGAEAASASKLLRKVLEMF